MKLKVQEIFDESFNTLFHNKIVLTFAIIGALLSVALGLFVNIYAPTGLTALTGRSSISPSLAPSLLSSLFAQLPSFITFAFIGTIIFILLYCFVLGALITGVRLSAKDKIGAAVKNAKERYFSLLGVTILSGMITSSMILLPLIIMAMAVSGAISPSALWQTTSLSIVLLMAVILLIVIGIAAIYIGIRLSLAPAEAVLGRRSIMESLRASWFKTRGKVLSIFFIFLLLLIIVWFLGRMAEAIAFVLGFPPIYTFISSFLGCLVIVAEVLIFIARSSPSPMIPKAKINSRALAFIIILVFAVEVIVFSSYLTSLFSQFSSFIATLVANNPGV